VRGRRGEPACGDREGPVAPCADERLYSCNSQVSRGKTRSAIHIGARAQVVDAARSPRRVTHSVLLHRLALCPLVRHALLHLLLGLCDLRRELALLGCLVEERVDLRGVK